MKLISNLHSYLKKTLAKKLLLRMENTKYRSGTQVYRNRCTFEYVVSRLYGSAVSLTTTCGQSASKSVYDTAVFRQEVCTLYLLNCSLLFIPSSTDGSWCQLQHHMQATSVLNSLSGMFNQTTIYIVRVLFFYLIINI
jgi:hypothetical protein